MGFKLSNLLPIPTSKAQYIIKHVKVAHHIPGRLRVIYPDLKHDEGLVKDVTVELEKHREITEFKINATTGSVLICYDIDGVANNAFLKEFLDLAIAQYGEAHG